MTSLLASLPLQLVCQFIIPGTSIVDHSKYEVNRSPSLVHRGTLPEGYIAPGFKAALLADLPLELVCKMLLSRNTVESDGPMPTPPVIPTQGYVSFSDDGAAYKVHTIPLTWDQARDRCVSEGAYLAVADSSKKIMHIKTIARYLSDEGMNLHVGIHNSEATNEWVGVENELPTKSIPWKSGYPTDIGSCVGISGKEDELFNYECNGPKGFFVCEISM